MSSTAPPSLSQSGELSRPAGQDSAQPDPEVHGGSPTLSILVPVYNEGDSIEAVLRSLQSHVRTPHEVLVVYDFEEDDTIPVVKSLHRELPMVRLHHNDLGRGVLPAIRSGVSAAKGELVLVTMADGSDDHSSVDNMVEVARSGAVVVAASRYTKGGAQIGGPRLKALASRTAGWLLHIVGGLPIVDPTNNFKLYDRSFLLGTEIESDRGFEVALELTVKAHLLGLPIAEVPTIWRDRTAGQSRFRYRVLLPGYLRWFFVGLRARLRARTPGRPPG